MMLGLNPKHGWLAASSLAGWLASGWLAIVLWSILGLTARSQITYSLHSYVRSPRDKSCLSKNYRITKPIRVTTATWSTRTNFTTGLQATWRYASRHQRIYLLPARCRRQGEFIRLTGLEGMVTIEYDEII